MFIAQFDALKKDLVIFQEKQDLGNLQANQFMFLAAHSLKQLYKSPLSDLVHNSEVVSELVAVGVNVKQAIKGEPKKKKKSLFNFNFGDSVIRYFAEIALEKIVESLAEDFKNDFGMAFTHHVNSMPKEIKINSLNSKEKWVSDFPIPMQSEPNLADFQVYYLNVAKLIDTLKEIEALAELDKSLSKQALFEKYGIAELYAGKKGEAFLNNIAKGLGFKDSKELHENYKNLHSRNLGAQKEAQGIFLQKRDKEFDTSKLNAIKSLYSEENKRILKKMEDKGQKFYQKNTHYASLMSYTSTEFGKSLGSSQVLNAVSNVVQEKVKEKMSSALEESPSDGLFEKAKKKVQKKAVEIVAQQAESLVEGEIKEKTAKPAAAIEQALDGVKQAVYAEKAAKILIQDREKKRDREQVFRDLFTDNHNWNLESLIKGYQDSLGKTPSMQEAYMAAFEVKIALMDMEGLKSEIEKNKKLPKVNVNVKNKALSIIDAQLNKVKKAKGKGLEELISSYGDNIEELRKIQDSIIKGNDDGSNFTLAQVIDFQKKYLEVQNELLVEIQEINNKLSKDNNPDLVIERIALLGKTKKLQELQSDFEPTKIGLPSDVRNFYSEKYKEGINKLGDFKEGEILEVLNKVVADKDKDKGLESVIYLLMNLDFKLINEKLTDKGLMKKILEKFDSKDMSITPVQRGWKQNFVDNDGKVMESIRLAFMMEEKLLKELEKKTPEGGAVYSEAEIAAKKSTIRQLRVHAVSTLVKDLKFDNRTRVEAQVRTWKKWEDTQNPITYQQNKEKKTYQQNKDELIGLVVGERFTEAKFEALVKDLEEGSKKLNQEEDCKETLAKLENIVQENRPERLQEVQKMKNLVFTNMKKDDKIAAGKDKKPAASRSKKI